MPDSSPQVNAVARSTPSGARGPAAWIGQLLLYGLFALGIGVFSHWPPYRHMAPGQALIKLSMVHTGKPVGDCRKLTPEELAKLPPNMRLATSCPRERSPITVELDIDGQPAARVTAEPSGLHQDGASAIYQRLTVPAGERTLAVRLRDDVRTGGFNYTLERHVTLAPAQVLVVDFDAESNAIALR